MNICIITLNNYFQIDCKSMLIVKLFKDINITGIFYQCNFNTKITFFAKIFKTCKNIVTEFPITNLVANILSNRKFGWKKGRKDIHGKIYTTKYLRPKIQLQV